MGRGVDPNPHQRKLALAFISVDKRTSLLIRIENYKKYQTVARDQGYKNFFSINYKWAKKSSVCAFQAFQA